MSETGLRNQLAELTTQHKAETGITLGNGDGSYDVVMDELRQVEGVEHADASVTSNDGYVAKAESVSGNTVTIVLYESAGSNAQMATVADGAGVADIRVVADGR